MKSTIQTFRRVTLTLIVISITLFVVAPPAVAQQKNNSPTKAIIKQLSDSKMEVGGAAVGYAGTPSKFYKLTKKLLKQGDKAIFLNLLKSKNVVCRIAGMLCLSQKHPKLAAVEVRKFLSSKAEVTIQEGCLVSKTTEGAIAKRFVENVYWLDLMGNKKTPLPEVS